ncbi:type IV pilus assembly PilZ [Solidesulfovibrio fructosivorans JJ]]|uniref:Type IV pilus assembly PilZ n=1 Tax=Solidesulfovibrio fructosivorans JJ] TaxID=596151 RepID=E1JZG4_SOLFR|nr:PilZ domain-containing protein [Solidesulfovibrio fructosivorans]EFL50211.1 type IV pilus assembly PilZ [Solidesulfovibrio fructosivorans JJ]]
MDFTFKLEGEVGKRAAYRERVRGLFARLEGDETAYVVHDVSASGVALVDAEGRLESGRKGLLSLAIGPKTLIAGLPVMVARIGGQGLVGLAFGELSLRQEAWLDKLVLEIQKRRIDLRKAREMADNLEDKKTDRADEQT